MIPIRSYSSEPQRGVAACDEMTTQGALDHLQPSRYIWVANDTITGLDKASAAR
jgi:hypothetical protein